jgi:phage/plasmid-like protein (TIGR03299 family)
MADEFESGFMVHTPSWHRKENAVLKESPRSWEEARRQAHIEWEVTTKPVWDVAYDDGLDDGRRPEIMVIDGYQQLRRDDTGALLSIQKSSYEVIPNAAFGGLIDAVLGLEDDERVEFETLMSLYEGRQIIALCYFPMPLHMPWDPSKTYTFCAFSSRHDGQGGLRGIPTNVRTVCANTFNTAEMTDGRTTGFTIRHTSNWDERVAQVRQVMVTARGQGKKWEEFTEQLARWDVTTRRREEFLKKLFPVSDDNGPRKNDNQLANRQAVKTILESPTCEDIRGNGYGLLMATSEWNDHFRQSQSVDTYVSRQLMRIEETKSRGARILRHMADIRV